MNLSSRRLNRVLIFFLLISLTCLSAQAQKYDINTINCKLSAGDIAYLNRVAKYEANFYNIVFNTTKNDSLPIRINIFGKLADYNKVQKDAMNTTFIDGFYSPGINQTYLFKNDRYLEIIQHESSHNMLRNNYYNPPQWLNEGIATFFGNLAVKDNEIVFIRPAYLTKIVKDLIYQGKFDLKGYFNYAPPDWYDKDKRDYLYAVAYCVIYFFVKDDIDNLGNILTLMKQGQTTPAAITHVFGSWEKFQKRFDDFYKPEVGYRL